MAGRRAAQVNQHVEGVVGDDMGERLIVDVVDQPPVIGLVFNRAVSPNGGRLAVLLIDIRIEPAAVPVRENGFHKADIAQHRGFIDQVSDADFVAPVRINRFGVDDRRWRRRRPGR